MEMKNIFKTAIFAVTLALGCAAAINFAPEAEAATYDYSNKVYQSYGQSDYGVANGFVYNINDLFDNYTNKERMTVGMDDPYGVYDIKIGSDLRGYYKDYIFNYNDPISAFVDIKHLSQVGDYLLFGNEYGYYAHTEKQEGRIVSTVLLFDVNYSKSDGGNYG